MKSILYGILITAMLFGLVWVFLGAVDKEAQIQEDKTNSWLEEFEK